MKVLRLFLPALFLALCIVWVFRFRDPGPSPPKLPVPTYRYVDYAYGVPFAEWLNGVPVAYWRTLNHAAEGAEWGVARVPITATTGPCVIVPMGATVRGTNVARLNEGFFTCIASR